MQTTRSAKGARTLRREYFTSQDIFDRETKNIFQKQWMCVGRIEEIEEPGKYFLYESDGESFIILKDHQHKIRCFYNVCRHRGTRICENREGNFKKTMQCPYHAWSYNLEGALVGAPNMQEVENFSKEEYPLHSVACDTWEGFIFINKSKNPEPFPMAFEPIWRKFSDWGIENLRSVKRLEYEVNANWKIIFQNFSECYHCPPVHPLLNKLTTFKSARNDIESGPFLGGPMMLTKSNQSMSMSGERCGDILPGLPENEWRQVHYYSLFPSVCVSPHPDYVLVHRIERKGVDQTKVICELLFHPDSINKPGFDPLPAIELWDLTNRQDWKVCELTQQGKSSEAYVPGPYSNLESILAAFDKNYLEHLNE